MFVLSYFKKSIVRFPLLKSTTSRSRFLDVRTFVFQTKHCLFSTFEVYYKQIKIFGRRTSVFQTKHCLFSYFEVYYKQINVYGRSYLCISNKAMSVFHFLSLLEPNRAV